MSSKPRSNPRGIGMALPLITLALVSWQAYPPLVYAWRNDLYSRGAGIAFLIWLIAQLIIAFRLHGGKVRTSGLCTAIAIGLCAGSAVSGLNVLNQLALAFAFPGVFGLRYMGVCVAAASVAWLPATGWFMSSFKSGGFAGWERPFASAVLGLALLLAALFAAKPRKTFLIP